MQIPKCKYSYIMLGLGNFSGLISLEHIPKGCMVSMKTVLTLCSLPSAATKHYIIKFVLHPPSEVCEHSSCVSTPCCILYASCIIICSPTSMRNYVC